MLGMLLGYCPAVPLSGRVGVVQMVMDPPPAWSSPIINSLQSLKLQLLSACLIEAGSPI